MSTDNSEVKRVARRRDYLAAALFAALWLAPILWVGWTNRSVPGWPKFLNNNYRIACLFPDRVGSWSNYYFQVRLRGTRDWVTVDESGYARMQPFGYRTRLHRAVGQSYYKPNVEQKRAAIAGFIRDRYESIHGANPGVAAVRIMRVAYLVGDPRIATPAGHWSKPPLDSITDGKYIVSTHSFRSDDDGRGP